ncbi:MAG TPA: hypothetical protein HA262_01645 [Methanosarcina sp.]|nr:hypothetical protein [Methanosarcina sp.]
MSSRYTTSQESTTYQTLLDENKLLVDENNTLKEEIQSLRACLGQTEGIERITDKLIRNRQIQPIVRARNS